LQNPLLHFGRLRNFAELVVRHDDTIVVVVLDVVEEPHAVFGREVLFRGVEYLRVWVGRAVTLGDLRDVGFQPDNHRLVRQPQPLHLVRRHAHDKRLSRADLVVADAAAVLLQHPDTILLALIDVLDSEPSVEGFQVEVGKCLVRTVVLRAHEAVELAVIHIRQPLLELRRLLREPFHEPVSYLVDLGVGELYALAVAHLDVVAVLVLADALGHVGHGVHEGVFQQGDTVVGAIIAPDTELVEDFGVSHAALDGIVVHTFRIADVYVGIEQVGGIGRVDARRYPPLAEVEVQLIERNRARRGLLQGGKRFSFPLAVRVLGHPCLNALRLVHYVACDEAVFDFVTAGERIVEDAPFQLVD